MVIWKQKSNLNGNIGISIADLIYDKLPRNQQDKSPKTAIPNPKGKHDFRAENRKPPESQ